METIYGKINDRLWCCQLKTNKQAPSLWTWHQLEWTPIPACDRNGHGDGYEDEHEGGNEDDASQPTAKE